ncbi:MAG: rod shape-determining protein MreD [Crocinitomicaceae bacterium]|nr:rod shape-determining protein MreD [Crocinitomicaceae bacterium]
MNTFLKFGVRFIFVVLIQVLVLNQIEFGFGIQLMIYPLFILLLPVELGIFPLLGLAFLMGMSIDAMSNTYGLHTSALLTFAYARPLVFKLFAPRDGYDTHLETNIFNMGNMWFLKTFGILIIIHHFWFFLMEIFKLNELLFIFQKVILSVPISFLVCILLQYLFVKKSGE